MEDTTDVVLKGLVIVMLDTKLEDTGLFVVEEVLGLPPEFVFDAE